jgi:hypothetical protein
MCVPPPASGEGDYTTMALAIGGPIGFIVLTVAFTYFYVRCVFKRDVKVADMVDQFFATMKSAAKLSFGMADLVTDLIVITSILADPTVSEYHPWYYLVGATSLIASALDMVVSILVSRTTLQHLNGNTALIRKKSEGIIEDFRRKSFRGKINPETGSFREIKLSNKEHWMVLSSKLQFWEKAAAMGLMLAEDLPMALLGIIYAADVASKDCGKLPGGLMTFMVSFGASCLFGGHRLFTAAGMLPQFARMRKIVNSAIKGGSIRNIDVDNMGGDSDDDEDFSPTAKVAFANKRGSAPDEYTEEPVTVLVPKTKSVGKMVAAAAIGATVVATS